MAIQRIRGQTFDARRVEKHMNVIVPTIAGGSVGADHTSGTG